MWVDIDDLRADLRALVRKDKEKLHGEHNLVNRSAYSGMLVAYNKVDMMLDELEASYRKQGMEYIRSLREEGNEEQREIQRSHQGYSYVRFT